MNEDAMADQERAGGGLRLGQRPEVGGVLEARGATGIIFGTSGYDVERELRALSETAQQFVTAVMMDNRLADRGPEPGHTIGEPLGDLSTVQRQAGGSSSLSHQLTFPEIRAALRFGVRLVNFLVERLFGVSTRRT
jgi:hypothetical protein